MIWPRFKKTEAGEYNPKRLIVWAICVGLLFGLIEFGEIAENWLRVGRNRINERPVSGQVVLVGIDGKSQNQVGRWPWPRSTYAAMLGNVEAARPKLILHDLLFTEPSKAADDRALADTLKRFDRNYIAALTQTGADGDAKRSSLPLKIFRDSAKLAAIDVRYNYLNQSWRVDYQRTLQGRPLPHMAAVLAEQNTPQAGTFPVNYEFDPSSVKTVSAADVLAGKVPAQVFAGKKVVIGIVDERIGDQYSIPGYGKYGGVYIHILAAETLMAGQPVDLGWWPAYLLAVLSVLVVAWSRSTKIRFAMFAVSASALLGLPLILERHNIFADVTPGLFVLLWVGCGLAWAALHNRGLVNAISGLPNLTALKRSKEGRDRPLIAARILNYAEIVSTMPADAEKQLVEQIVKRLRVGGEETKIYQSDEGIFAWTIPTGTAIGHHVEALHSLFRTPARVSGKSYDVSLTFGVEIGSGRSIANRLASALVAAEEASSEGLKWKYYDPERLRDATWRLSLLSQLDDAIANGEVWVAFQPQLDLRNGRLRGAEALARWTHPEKGPISPTEFVSAAEQSNRIETLTMFVLEQAISTAARINREYGPFDMAVNLSARLLHDQGLASKVRSLLQSHGLPAQRLTLELTETAAMANGEGDIEALLRLRDLGINISIDDYGTGLSTLDYLKKVPANEIKIDQSFIKSMRDNRSDMVMVQSTIALAHSLGRTVVAEGVEDREALELLRTMDCEFAQGFAISRPTSVEGLMRRIHKPRIQGVA